MYLKDTKLPTLRSFLFYALLPFLVIPTGAVAEGLMITPYLGYRVGGDFTDISSGIELELAESESYGLIIGKDNGTSDQMEFIYSIQPTNLTATGTVTSGVLVDVDVENFLFAGKKILNKESGTFMSGMIGATRFDPSSSGLNSETRFALGLGGGIDHRISDRVGFRLEGRGIATFLDSDGAIFCGPTGGCLVFTESNVLWQFEVVAGLTFRF
jgi:opacity protein-like surface antigen